MRTEYSFNHCELLLQIPNGNKLYCQPRKSSLVFEREKLAEYRLSFQVNWENYQQIISHGLLYFDQDFQAVQTQDCLPEYNEVEITTLLRPDLLPKIENYVTDAATVAAYLEKLSHEEPNNLLLSTESWLGLSVKQHQPQGQIGYRTVWDYLDWSAIAQNNTEEVDDLLLGAIVNFFKDSAAHQLLAENPNAAVNQQVIETTTQLLETLFAVVPSVVAGDKNANQHIASAIADVFKELLQGQISTYLEETIAGEPIVESTVSFPSQPLAENLSKIAQRSTEASTIFDALVSFFQQENWSTTQLQRQPILHLDFQGEHGTWVCYAQAREAEQQFIFYSVLPVKVPQESRQYVAEFITRANYGIILGNFELDFSDGEIRYKTSIDVNGTNVNSAMIRQLVYSNLLNTDKYLLGIMQVIHGKVSPAEAIAQIESQPE